ncbi:inactive glucose-1-phosphate adenylyltransferase small subunit 2, chloroplastic [Coffea eugenioides]|uniref:inactive glucose-1-phosphate adenylyltransferase small subunit 2, chloroplastic n=1 Tax=Coffea eugenioides TaxID=49369 RepID=UPI000F60C0C8|nr:inactive glucose-1-phosphate adenylyltransferase small subunit 2, chloroplastic [Coffea eugenioides]
MSLHVSSHLNIVQLPHNYNYAKPALKLTVPAARPPPPSLAVKNVQQNPEHAAALICNVQQSVAAIVFGDGSPSRLYPLTKRRSEGAIPIAGNYRLIDAVVSNCINSNISKIYALTQFNSTSLNSHLSRAYSGASLGKEGFVEVIAACQTPEAMGWFKGPADAIRRSLSVLEEYPVLEFLILPGHHLYKMNYQKLVEAHRNNSADITIAVHGSRRYDNPGFGIFTVNSKNQVTGFLREPGMNPESAQHSATFTDIPTPYNIYPGMGIYVINRDVMINLVTEHFPTANDLTGEIMPGAISLGMKIHAYKFEGYWEDMTSIEAFYHANMESTKNASTAAHNSFYDRDNPLYTLPRHLPPTLITDAVIVDSVVGDGCVLSRCKIKGTVVGMRTRVGEGATIEDSIIMGSDTYPGSIVQGVNANHGVSNIPIGIGEGAVIKKAIVDKNARIGKNVLIINKDNVQEGDKEANGYVIRKGIIIIIERAIISDGTIL